ncbi:MAG: TRAP transporter TatT component family protein [Nevskiales bacterium]
MLGLTACGALPATQSLPQPGVSLDKAMAAYERVESRADLLAAIDLLDTYAQQHPQDYASRARLANAYTLLGAGYAKTLREKADAYSRAMEVAEQAMMTSDAYAQARSGIGSFTDAIQSLDVDYIEAMEFWKTALFYSFREAQDPISKLLRYPRLRKAVAVMQHIDSLDRNAIGGSNLMSLGIYYLALPEFAGGDRQKSAEYLAQAAAVSERSILPRWGRAKYYAVAMQDKNLYQSDLKWVVSRPLNELIGYRPWNILLQREAAQMLQSSDEATLSKVGARPVLHTSS